MHVRASPLSAPVPASRRRGPTGCLARQPFGSHHWHVKVVPGVLRGLLTTSTRHPDLNLPGRSQSPPDPLFQRSLPARIRIRRRSRHRLSRHVDPAGLLAVSITAPAPGVTPKDAFFVRPACPPGRAVWAGRHPNRCLPNRAAGNVHKPPKRSAHRVRPPLTSPGGIETILCGSIERRTLPSGDRPGD